MFGTMQIGRVTLREDRELTRSVDDTGVVTVAITGQESCPHLTKAQTTQRAQDILGLSGALVPVVFTEKPELNGYYIVDGPESDQSTYIDVGVNLIPWHMNLIMIGTDSEIDLESRTGGAQTRANDFTGTGERWHAPAIGALGYYTTGAVPSVVSRTSADGVMPVYRNVPFGVHPRWACPVGSYGLGRTRFLTGGVERSGIAFAPLASDWEINNGLVRVKPLTSGGVLEISAWTGGTWQAKTWNITLGGTTLGTFDRISLLRNDYECVQVRLFKSLASGRCTVDLTLIRGARFVQIYVQTSTTATMKIVRGTAEAGTLGTNSSYVRAASVDGAGNRYVVGSAHTITQDLTNGGFTRTATVVMDAFVGVEIAAAPSGDAALDLFNQYIGVPTERVQGVIR